jgi:4-amino-4-deoxy-L-arabinose transferase-like glycosyltransferase
LKTELSNNRAATARKALLLVFIVALAFAVRSLSANFLRAHFNDPGWFQFGSYQVFDRQAQDVLDGKESFFWIPDATRTDLIQYPPGSRLWIAAIYAATGERSAAAVQRVQVFVDSLAVLLIVGTGVSTYGWRVGLISGILAALSPLLAMYGGIPGADAPATWTIVAALWFLVLTAKTRKLAYALAAGGILGVACWLRVNPFLLFIVWAASLMFFVDASFKKRTMLSSAVALSTLLVMSPVVIRNLAIFYPQFAPTGLNIGLNLWEGLGETDKGHEFGAPGSDLEVLAQDRKEMGLPEDAPLALNYPDGIRRDRERARRAFAIIKAHPFWYTGTMLHRLVGHFRLAGAPQPHVGSAGFNVTGRKCLPPNEQGGVISIAVNGLGMLQSVLRYLMLPLIVAGVWFALKQNKALTALLLCTVGYYLATLAVGHSEIRYGLPMQIIFVVFAAVAVEAIATWSYRLWQLRHQA